jgi:hypothetical protein
MHLLLWHTAHLWQKTSWSLACLSSPYLVLMHQYLTLPYLPPACLVPQTNWYRVRLLARAFKSLGEYLTHIKSWSDPPGSAFFLASVAAFLWFPTYTAAVYCVWVSYRE